MSGCFSQVLLKVQKYNFNFKFFPSHDSLDGMEEEEEEEEADTSSIQSDDEGTLLYFPQL